MRPPRGRDGPQREEEQFCRGRKGQSPSRCEWRLSSTLDAPETGEQSCRGGLLNQMQKPLVWCSRLERIYWRAYWHRGEWDSQGVMQNISELQATDQIQHCWQGLI